METNERKKEKKKRTQIYQFLYCEMFLPKEKVGWEPFPPPSSPPPSSQNSQEKFQGKNCNVSNINPLLLHQSIPP